MLTRGGHQVKERPSREMNNKGRVVFNIDQPIEELLELDKSRQEEQNKIDHRLRLTRASLRKMNNFEKEKVSNTCI